MRALRFTCLSVLASVVICVSSAMGQNAAPAVRIVNPIDEEQLVTLGGPVHPLANAKNDRGPSTRGIGEGSSTLRIACYTGQRKFFCQYQSPRMFSLILEN